MRNGTRTSKKTKRTDSKEAKALAIVRTVALDIADFADRRNVPQRRETLAHAAAYLNSLCEELRDTGTIA